MSRFVLILSLFLTSLSANSQVYEINLSQSQIEALGLLIWKNEGRQELKHLTSWNRGEYFPSLGLGHFIWYTNKEKGPFKEQFPELLKYLQENGVLLPQWLADSQFAPWQSREQFYKEFHDKQLTELRELLSANMNLQVQFIILRLKKAIPLILETSQPQQKAQINKQLARLTATPEGIFVLLDYINFKGEGISAKESYQGEGWGLKQVLLAMPDEYQDPLYRFALGADEVLTRRVKNAPKKELRWLKGWRVRIHGYY